MGLKAQTSGPQRQREQAPNGEPETGANQPYGQDDARIPRSPSKAEGDVRSAAPAHPRDACAREGRETVMVDETLDHKKSGAPRILPARVARWDSTDSDASRECRQSQDAVLPWERAGLRRALATWRLRVSAGKEAGRLEEEHLRRIGLISDRLRLAEAAAKLGRVRGISSRTAGRVPRAEFRTRRVPQQQQLETDARDGCQSTPRFARRLPGRLQIPEAGARHTARGESPSNASGMEVERYMERVACAKQMGSQGGAGCIIEAPGNFPETRHQTAADVQSHGTGAAVLPHQTEATVLPHNAIPAVPQHETADTEAAVPPQTAMAAVLLHDKEAAVPPHRARAAVQPCKTTEQAWEEALLAGAGSGAHGTMGTVARQTANPQPPTRDGFAVDYWLRHSQEPVQDLVGPGGTVWGSDHMLQDCIAGEGPNTERSPRVQLVEDGGDSLQPPFCTAQGTMTDAHAGTAQNRLPSIGALRQMPAVPRESAEPFPNISQACSAKPVPQWYLLLSRAARGRPACGGLAREEVGCKGGEVRARDTAARIAVLQRRRLELEQEMMSDIWIELLFVEVRRR